ncbi:MAG: hypothetical protein ABI625_17430 [bacterium]
MEDEELERLCDAARVANPVPLPREMGGGLPSRIVAPEFVVSKDALAVADRADGAEPEKASRVRDTVRLFAHEARVNKLPAIEAMVRLKAILADTYSADDVDESTRAEAANLRLVRRWFVDAFYFNRPA